MNKPFLKKFKITFIFWSHLVCYREGEIYYNRWLNFRYSQRIFFCLGSSVINKNDVSLVIKHRNTVANSCYYGLNWQVSSRNLYWTTKTNILQDAHSTRASLWLWSMNAIKYWTDVAAMSVFERKVLRKNFVLVQVGDDFRNWFSNE